MPHPMNSTLQGLYSAPGFTLLCDTMFARLPSDYSKQEQCQRNLSRVTIGNATHLCSKCLKASSNDEVLLLYLRIHQMCNLLSYGAEL
jgi:hypothetical protein